MRGRLICAAAVVGAAFGIAAGAQPAPPPAGLTLPRSVLVSELIGMRVRTQSGERVGAIADLVVTSNHAVSAAVVSVGGFFGLGEKRVEVPLDRLALDRDASIVVSLTREDIDALPPYATESYAIVPPAAERP